MSVAGKNSPLVHVLGVRLFTLPARIVRLFTLPAILPARIVRLFMLPARIVRLFMLPATIVRIKDKILSYLALSKIVLGWSRPHFARSVILTTMRESESVRKRGAGREKTKKDE